MVESQLGLIIGIIVAFLAITGGLVLILKRYMARRQYISAWGERD